MDQSNLFLRCYKVVHTGSSWTPKHDQGDILFELKLEKGITKTIIKLTIHMWRFIFSLSVKLFKHHVFMWAD